MRLIYRRRPYVSEKMSPENKEASMARKHPKQRWKVVQKMRLVAESWQLKGDMLGCYLRRNGLHSNDLNLWKEQMAMGIDADRPMYCAERKDYRTRIKELQRKLREAEAIIELQKKVKNVISEKEVKKQKKKQEEKS